jgi:hypothetical protein
LLLREPDPAQVGLYAVVTPDPARGSFNAEVVDMTGNRYLRLRGYRTITIPNAVDSGQLKVLQTLMTAEAALVA